MFPPGTAPENLYSPVHLGPSSPLRSPSPHPSPRRSPPPQPSPQRSPLFKKPAPSRTQPSARKTRSGSAASKQMTSSKKSVASKKLVKPKDVYSLNLEQTKKIIDASVTAFFHPSVPPSKLAVPEDSMNSFMNIAKVNK